MGLLFGTAVAALASALVAVAALAYFRGAPVIAPGVTIGGLPAAGLSPEQVSADLDRTWNVERRLQAVDNTDPARAWAVRPSELGLKIDAAATVRQALAVGRSPGALAGLSQVLASLGHGTDVKPAVTFDPAAARAGLEAWAIRTKIPSTDATLDIRDGSVVTRPGQPGTELNVDRTLALLASDPAGMLLGNGIVPFVFEPRAPRIADASAAAAEAERLIASGLTLAAYDPVTDERLSWTPSRPIIASWLDINAGDGAYQVQVNPDRVRGYLTDLDRSLGGERGLDLEAALPATMAGLQGVSQPALIVHYRPTSYRARAGETLQTIGWRIGMPAWKMREFNPGVGGRALAAGEAVTLPPKDAMLALPVVANKRIVISLSQQRMWVYQDGALVAEHVVSTGISRSPTMAGLFQIQSHILNAYASTWDLWMPHFMGIYDALPGFTNGIHGLPLLSSGVRLWGNVLGRPASFGCIILDLKAAEELYNWAEDGVVVEIRR